MKKISKWLKLTFSIGMVCCFVLPLYLQNSFGDIDFEQVLYTMVSKGNGANFDMFFDYLWFGLPYFLVFGILAVSYYCISKRTITLKFKWFGKTCSKDLVFRPSLKRTLISSAVAAIMVGLFANYTLDVSGYVSERLNPGILYETNYVNPDDVTITFPETKQNLIYIVLESMNTNFNSVAVDGQTVNLIPNLEALAKSNVNISDNSGFGGHIQVRGLTWTAASLVGQTSGVSLQVPISLQEQSYGLDGEYLPGLTTLGEILEKHGYKNYFLMGSDADFAGRQQYFETHGNYEILDLKTMKEIGYIPEDYYVFWGMEDSKLFDYAKEKLTEISKSEEPFNFSMLTVDSHFMDGYTDASCLSEYSVDYANAIACSDTQIYEFITWIQAQDFYENSTIILVGDHNSMNHDFIQLSTDDAYTIYNAFINVNRPVAAASIKNRDFTVMDLFPTTLSALGADIEGHRLGLGVDLFSGERTLLEKFGVDNLNEELGKKSYYYETEFFIPDS